MTLTEIDKVVLQCIEKTNSHFLPGEAIQILFKSLEERNKDATLFS